MNQAECIKQKKLFLFDMDGTLYIGDRLFPFTIPLLSAIKSHGGKYLFVTNNSSRSIKDYIAKLAKLGISASIEDFLTSSQATAYYLNQHHKGQTLYVCGTESLKTELKNQGFILSEDLEKIDCIVIGFDTELTYQKLYDISYLLLTRPDLPFIATNPDLVCPTEFGSIPDCGSMCQMIFNATGKSPVVIGKPSPLMPQLAMTKLGYSKEETCVIGDRIYTDVKSGLNAGITSILVMSGETTGEILNASTDKPHIVLQDAGELIPYLT